MTIEVADRLVKLRKKYGYSQEELADKLGLSRQAVSKWERAEASPDTDNLICLAKLYGVSLDELLATDEDIDTIVKEQVKNDEEKVETEDRTEETSKRENIVINNKGIFLSDKDGSKVTIDKRGIVLTDKDGEVTVKKPGSSDPVMNIIGGVEGALYILAIVTYILLGSLLNMWHNAWVVVFVPEIICSVARAIRKKNGQQFNVTFLCCFAFFFVCMVYPVTNGNGQLLWHPMWAVFLGIPLYHTVVGVIRKAKGKDNVYVHCCENNDEDDDDEDDEDDD